MDYKLWHFVEYWRRFPSFERKLLPIYYTIELLIKYTSLLKYLNPDTDAWIPHSSGQIRVWVMRKYELYKQDIIDDLKSRSRRCTSLPISGHQATIVSFRCYWTLYKTRLESWNITYLGFENSRAVTRERIKLLLLSRLLLNLESTLSLVSLLVITMVKWYFMQRTWQTYVFWIISIF